MCIGKHLLIWTVEGSFSQEVLFGAEAWRKSGSWLDRGETWLPSMREGKVVRGVFHSLRNERREKDPDSPTGHTEAGTASLLQAGVRWADSQFLQVITRTRTLGGPCKLARQGSHDSRRYSYIPQILIIWCFVAVVHGVTWLFVFGFLKLERILKEWVLERKCREQEEGERRYENEGGWVRIFTFPLSSPETSFKCLNLKACRYLVLC